MTLLKVDNLTLQFDTDEGRITAVDDVSFELNPGEVLGLVGESGSGKSVTAKSIMQLNPENAVYSPDSKIFPRDAGVFQASKTSDLHSGGAIAIPRHSG